MQKDSRGNPCLPPRPRPAHVQRMLEKVKKDGDYYDDYPKHYMLPEHGQEYALLEYIDQLERAAATRELVREWWVIHWHGPLGWAHETHSTRGELRSHIRRLKDMGRTPSKIEHIKRYRRAKSSPSGTARTEP